MNQKILLIHLPLLCTALAFLGGSLIAERESPALDEDIHFLDMQRCFNEVPAVVDEMDRLRAQFAPTSEAFRQKDKSLRATEGELLVMDPNSMDFLTKKHELETARLTLERSQQFQLQRFQTAQSEVYVRAARLIQAKAEEIGRLKGYAGIFVSPPSLDDLPQETQIAAEFLNSRKLLWVHPQLDMTQEVIESLSETP
ncbi:MAG: OmpH family outer membrane protein [Planctomycetota bacterium]|jgi:Skp family chaperone for outer membrane proteins|nr:OmpH family outer membrane protein [Planctomycetota bacterium]